MELGEVLLSIGEAELLAPVSDLFGARVSQLVDTTSTPLSWIGMRPSERALSRWQGSALVAGVKRSWSLILKIQRRVPESDDPDRWDYWRREFLAYESGLLDHLPGVTAPGCHGAVERGEDALLWLDDVPEATPGTWRTERYVRAAHDLGVFNGAFLAGRPVPQRSWLTRTYLRSWTTWLPWSELARSEATWSLPIVARAFPRPPGDRLTRLYRDTPKLLERLEHLRQTFSHLDCWRANLIGQRLPDGTERTVLIDWSFTGAAPAGQDLAILVAGSHVWLDADPAELTVLSDGALAAYISGMREIGWRGDERDVRFGYAASSALYGAPLVPWWLPRLADPARREWLEAKCRRPAEEVAAGWALLLEHLLKLADEAEQLLPA